MSGTHFPLIILGSGPAGYTAAVYAARAMLKPALISGMQPGGQLTITTDVENYPGFAAGVQGPDLMEEMRKQAERFGTQFICDHIDSADLSQRPFTLKGQGKETYTCDALIIATGAQAKWLGVEGEERFKGYGVSACATCDGFFFRDKHVFVIGGGNTAVEEALFLTNFARKVTVVHRRNAFRAEKILQERLFAHPKAEIIWDKVVEQIGGQDNPPAVTRISLRDVKTGERSEHPADGVFVAIGHAPATTIFNRQLDMRAGGYLDVRAGTTLTNIEGVFAAGDVCDDIYRQAITAAGMGCMAALDAERFLAAREHISVAAE
jgi:thioredoxin reductase (NADPH)